MDDEVIIKGSSPQFAKQMALKLLEGNTPFIAKEAIYAHNMEHAFADFGHFPLLIWGTFAEKECTVRIGGIDVCHGKDILKAFGFKEADAINPSETQFVKSFHRHLEFFQFIPSK